MKKIQDMQENLEQKQAELDEKEFSASAGGGAVTATVTGKFEIKAISLKPEIVDKDDIEMLEDLIISATNEALRSAKETSETEMAEIQGGLSIPGLF